MPRIPVLDSNSASADIRATFDAVKGKLGVVPNLLKTIAHAPSVLNSYLGFSGAVGGGALPATLREQLALLSAETNGCDYCASAHQAIGKMVGLDADEIVRGYAGDSADPKARAALVFAKSVLANRGKVSDADFTAVKAAGYSDGDVLEIVANLTLNIFTNYLNNVAQTDIDFPRVHTGRSAS
ncbi:carboxymuconolactone decarboxylase family protein [Methylosinus sp. LW4]|uniref:carboxymuconolactone decarboxylase family protein n=1 Tax=Methylosinus sp. LW4 TaxID=136993 RepID=UPI00036CE095|nr:carboxymuconolactone decarboxylase family protein [Methylosinus sp. LW4]